MTEVAVCKVAEGGSGNNDIRSRGRCAAIYHIRQGKGIGVEVAEVVAVTARQIRITDPYGTEAFTATPPISVGATGNLQVTSAQESIGGAILSTACTQEQRRTDAETRDAGDLPAIKDGPGKCVVPQPA